MVRAAASRSLTFHHDGSAQMKCYEMPASVTIKYEDGTKIVYSTTDRLVNSSYCYKPAGGQFPHFTVVDTNAGNADFARFHITDTLGTKEVRAFYSGTTFENFASTTIKVPKVLADVWHKQAKWFWDAVQATKTT
jgi:hypothetical protein